MDASSMLMYIVVTKQGRRTGENREEAAGRQAGREQAGREQAGRQGGRSSLVQFCCGPRTSQNIQQPQYVHLVLPRRVPLQGRGRRIRIM